MEASLSSNLLDEIDQQQNEVLEQLEALDQRIQALITNWQGEDREREAEVKQVLANVGMATTGSANPADPSCPI